MTKAALIECANEHAGGINPLIAWYSVASRVDEMGVTALNPVEYGKLLAKVRPKVIETEAEFRQASETLENLTFADRELSPAELALCELLKKLVVDYDDHMRPLPNVEPRRLLKSLMEQPELKQRDLIPVLGRGSTVADILSGKRTISKTQAKKLAEFFRVSMFLTCNSIRTARSKAWAVSPRSPAYFPVHERASINAVSVLHCASAFSSWQHAASREACQKAGLPPGLAAPRRYN